jgi:hypothetical protein
MIGFFGFEDNWILTRENDENAWILNIENDMNRFCKLKITQFQRFKLVQLKYKTTQKLNRNLHAYHSVQNF